jgi:2-polyprenyl-3-methyl-5-hydroxy-6-metoxy-1,4-benzoquinol methylase
LQLAELIQLHFPASPLLAQARESLPEVLGEKYGDLAHGGWAPRLRARFGHATPDDWYEACVATLVMPTTCWLDVGCGHDIFPSNAVTATRLAARCRLLVGVDPSDNIDDNSFVHERVKLPIEQYRPDRRYDLITLRMVAEHIADPPTTVARLAALLAPGGRVVVYTVSRWSPSALVAACSPLSFHHAVKRVLWRVEAHDTFPTVYVMNTHAALRRLFTAAGLQEEAFERLADCRTTARFRWPQAAELGLWRALQKFGLNYPENCILAVYRAPP